jgi:phage/plasmid-associated DNA primase
VLVQEPDKKNKINTSTIKELTGDKAINCRTLYSKATTTLLKLTFCMECNDLPQLDESGDAMARRIDVTPFDSMFMNSHTYEGLTNEDKSTGMFHLANPLYNTDDFQDNHKQALMEILMEHFKVFKSNKFIIKPPKAVIQEANEYLKYSDDFYEWFTNTFKEKEGCHISFKTIHIHYSSSDYFSNLTKADKRRHNAKFLKNTILNNMFLKKHFKKAKYGYCGLKLESDSIVGYEYRRDENDDDSDDEDTTDSADEN